MEKFHIYMTYMYILYKYNAYISTVHKELTIHY